MESHEILDTLAQFKMPACHSVNLKFLKFEDGFWFRKEFDLDYFLQSSHRAKSKKMKLRLFLTHVRQRLLGKSLIRFKSQITLPWELSPHFADVLRIANGSLLIWAGDDFFKLPINQKCEERIKKSKDRYSALMQTDIKDFIIPVQYLLSGTAPDLLYQKSYAGRFIRLDPSGIKRLDNFIIQYFRAACASHDSYDMQSGQEARPGQNKTLIRGIEHGDLQVNNILEFSGGKIGIIDLDQYGFKGFPFVDIMSFAVHYLGFYSLGDYFSALELLFTKGASCSEYLRAAGFKQVAECWDKNYSAEYLLHFINNRKIWTQANQPEEKFTKKFSETVARFSKLGNDPQ